MLVKRQLNRGAVKTPPSKADIFAVVIVNDFTPTESFTTASSSKNTISKRNARPLTKTYRAITTYKYQRLEKANALTAAF